MRSTKTRGEEDYHAPSRESGGVEPPRKSLGLASGVGANAGIVDRGAARALYGSRALGSRNDAPRRTRSLASRRPRAEVAARHIDQIAVGRIYLRCSADRVNLVATMEIERIHAFDCDRDAVPIKRDPLYFPGHRRKCVIEAREAEVGHGRAP